MAVELSLPPSMRLDPVFVVSQLKYVPNGGSDEWRPDGATQREDLPVSHEEPPTPVVGNEPELPRQSARLASRPRKVWRKADVAHAVSADTGEGPKVTGLAALPKPGPGEAERVILYYSRQLLPSEKNYHITELELRGLVVAILRCQEWVQGCKHLWVVTDHAPLVSILGRGKNTAYNSRVERFRMDILPYLSYMTVVHKPGKAHSNVDTLSRIPLPFFSSPCDDDKVDGSIMA